MIDKKMIMLFLKLIRFPNLLVIVLVQYLMRYAIMSPILQKNGFELQMSNTDFFLLVLSTALLAAAGYVINDYFDRKSDMINRPDEVIVGHRINRRLAMLLHVVLNTIAIIIGFYLSYKIAKFELAVVYLIVPGLLWYYSTFFQKKVLIGNFVLAGFVALVPLLVPLFEIPLLRSVYNSGIIKLNTDFENLFIWILSFAFFAFMMTMIFVLIKDMANKEGDIESGRKSLPIVFGVKNTKIVIYFISIITIAISLYLIFTRMFDVLTLTYYIVAILLPFVLLIRLLASAKTVCDFQSIELYPKIIMLAGIAYTIIVYLLLKFPDLLIHVL